MGSCTEMCIIIKTFVTCPAGDDPVGLFGNPKV